MSIAEATDARAASFRRNDSKGEPPGRVVAVSAASHGTAKRGLAAGIARALAGIEGGRVCIVDADTDAREVGWRMGVTGPSVAQLSDDIRYRRRPEPLAHIAYDRSSGCWVVPLGNERDRSESHALQVLLPELRAEFDFIIVDAPVAFAMHGRPIDEVIQVVDELLVAADARASAPGILVRYLNRLTRGRITGELPVTLEVRVVPTGEHREESATWLQDVVRMVPVTDVVPPLWGRNASLFDDDVTGVPDNLVNVARELTSVR